MTAGQAAATAMAPVPQTPSVAPRWPWARLGVAAFWTALWAGALAAHGFRGDVQMDLAIGRWILAHHALPTRNWWSAAAFGQPFVPTEWGFAAAVAAVDALAGRWGIFALMVVACAALAGLISARLPAGRWRWVAVLAVGAVLYPTIPPRPELWSYVGWAGTLAALRRHRATGRRDGLWAVAAATALWAQVHASAALVPLALAWETATAPRPRRSRLWGPLALASLGSLANAGGLATGLAFTGQVLTPAIWNTVAEWMPFAPRSAWGGLVLAGLCATWMAVGSRAWRARDVRTLGWLVAGTVAAAFAQRLVPYAVLGFLECWAPCWQGAGPEAGPRRVWHGGADAVLALGVLAAIWIPVGRAGVFAPAWPASVLALLRAAHATNIVAPQGDTLDAAGLLPWVNGQVQLYAHAPWWPAWVATARGQASPADFVARYDPQSRWIVWPLETRPGFGPLTLPPPWHLVWRGAVRWPGTAGPVPTAVWTRPADPAQPLP